MELSATRSTLPVLHTCDAVVIGASLAGTAAALALAGAGKRVTLVEPRTYPGREISATLRPWLDAAALDAVPAFVQAAVEASGKARGAEIALNLDAFKLALEDALLAAGVKLLYASLVTGVHAPDSVLQGVVIGNKSGRQVIRCALAVDTSETALTARLTGAAFAPATGDAVYQRTLEFDGVAADVDLTQAIMLDGVRAELHAGYRERGHVLLDCALTLPAASPDAFALSARECAARQRTMAFAAALIRQTPAFESAYLAGASHELAGVHTPRRLPLADASARSGAPLLADLDVTPGKFASGEVRGLWHLNASTPAPGLPHTGFDDPAFCARLGDALGRHVAAESAHTAEIPDSAPDAPPQVADGLRLCEPVSPQRGMAYPRVAVATGDIPVLRDVDVLVVGGGSSGASAAIHAAREGVRTVLLEMNPGLGGTGTYGGVHSYWFGRREGFAGRIMGLVNAEHRALAHPEAQGLIPKWNIEAKAYALLKEAQGQGVDVLLNAYVTGVLIDDSGGADRVAGVLVATRTGPALIRATVTIDASGDGDVAAFGGAKFVYGDARDHSTMWYALAQFARPGLTRNHFTSTVDVSNIEDYTRAILAGRRRGADGVAMHDHGVYVAPRESRHIVGEIALTLTDQMRRRRWPDVVNVAFSNHDVKGHTGSDWLRIGLIPPNLEIEIPYRALLPAGLDGLLVVGKALSADHDALPAIRMQADLENLGGTAALAAAQSVRTGQPLKGLDIRQLQARLVQESILPPDVLTRTLTPLHVDADALRAQIAALPDDKPLYAYSDMELSDIYDDLIPLVEVCCAGPEVVPLLEAALDDASGARAVLLAQALALVGSARGVPVLLDAVAPHLAGDRLPARTAHIRYTQLPPDHGAMPDVVYLLYSLGMAPDARTLPVWVRVVDLLAHVREADFYEQMPGAFYYVDVVGFAAERLALPALIPTLKALHAHPALHGKHSAGGFQPDYVQERLAYLEVVIGRALARCGSADGFTLLITYLTDSRALLAEQAHSELVAITGEDHGKDVQRWGEWLEQHADDLRPSPWRHVSDAVRAWQDASETLRV